MKTRMLFLFPVLVTAVMIINGISIANAETKTFKWIFQGQADNTPESVWASDQREFGDIVRAATNGQVDITYVSDVCKDNAVLDTVKKRELNLGFMGVHYKPDMALMNFQTLPIVPNDRLPEILAILKPKFDDIWQKQWGVKLLAFNYYLPQMLYTKKPADTLENLKPQRIRQFNRDLINLYKRANCTPVMIKSIRAVQKNLDEDKIDGAQGGIPAYVNWGWAETLKYISDWPLGSTYMALVVNMDDWNSLTPELQKKLLSAAEELEQNQWKSRQAYVKILFDQARTKYAAKVMNPSPSEVKKLLLNIDPVLEEWKNKMGPDSMMIFDAINKVLGTNYK